MLKADSARNRLTGIALVSLCYLLFTLLDGTAKWLVASVPVIVVVWLRFLMHAVFASALLLPLRGISLVRTSHWRWHLLRALMFVLMTGINFWALQYLQLAITSSIMFIVPIVSRQVPRHQVEHRVERGVPQPEEHGRVEIGAARPHDHQHAGEAGDDRRPASPVDVLAEQRRGHERGDDRHDEHDRGGDRELEILERPEVDPGHQHEHERTQQVPAPVAGSHQRNSPQREQ